MSPPDPPADDDPPARLAKTNAALAEWTARNAADSGALMERLERMGYAIRGKSEDEIAEVLKHPPTEPGSA